MCFPSGKTLPVVKLKGIYWEEPLSIAPSGQDQSSSQQALSSSLLTRINGMKLWVETDKLSCHILISGVDLISAFIICIINSQTELNCFLLFLVNCHFYLSRM